MHSFISVGRRWYATAVAATIIIWCTMVTAHSEPLPGRTFTSYRRSITSLTCDADYLWAGTSGDGLLRISKTDGETVASLISDSGTTDNCIRALSFDSEGTLLAGTLRSGILRFTDATWERISGLVDSTVTGLTIDNTGTLWAWMANQEVFQRTGDGWDAVVGQFQGAMTRSPDGSIWLLKTPPRDTADCSAGWIRQYGSDREVLSSVSLEPLCGQIGELPVFAADDYDNCWLASGDYLFRFTGDSITPFLISDTSEHKRITTIAIGSDNIILFAERDFNVNTYSLYLYDPAGDGEPLDSCIFTSEFPAVDKACADATDGGFWCMTLMGTVIRVDASGNVSALPENNAVLPANSITSLLVDNSDNVWVATPAGIARYHDSSWTRYPAENDSMPGEDVSTLAMDSSGTVWAGFQQSPISSMVVSGLSYFNGDHWSLFDIHWFAVRAIAVDASGSKWVATDLGVQRYQTSEPDTVFWSPENKQVLYDPWLNTLVFDNNGTPWLGTNEGIKRYENDIWINDTNISDLFPEASDPTSVNVNVSTIVFVDETAWIGTDRGLLKYDGNDYERFDISGDILPDCHVLCINADESTGIWIGTKKGLLRISGQNHMTYTTDNSPLFSNYITACASSRSGDLWIGTLQGGLTVFSQSGIAVEDGFSPEKNMLPKARVTFTAVRKRLIRISLQTVGTPDITFSVISLNGRCIRQFNGKAMHDGITTLFWDGTDRFNRPVSAGMYMGIATVNGSVVGRRLLPLQ